MVVIPSGLNSRHIILIVVMLYIVEQGSWTMVCTLLLFLLYLTYKIINKIKTIGWPRPRKRVWGTMMLQARGSGKVFTYVCGAYVDVVHHSYVLDGPYWLCTLMCYVTPWFYLPWD